MAVHGGKWGDVFMSNYNARIQMKTDTLAAWEASNPVLLSNEVVAATACSNGGEFDTRFKIGDGVNNFKSLPFIDAAYIDAITELKAQIAKSVVVYVGSGAPSNSIGNDNDIYIDLG